MHFHTNFVFYFYILDLGWIEGSFLIALRRRMLINLNGEFLECARKWQHVKALTPVKKTEGVLNTVVSFALNDEISDDTHTLCKNINYNAAEIISTVSSGLAISVKAPPPPLLLSLLCLIIYIFKCLVKVKIIYMGFKISHMHTYIHLPLGYISITLRKTMQIVGNHRLIVMFNFFKDNGTFIQLRFLHLYLLSIKVGVYTYLSKNLVKNVELKCLEMINKTVNFSRCLALLFNSYSP